MPDFPLNTPARKAAFAKARLLGMDLDAAMLNVIRKEGRLRINLPSHRWGVRFPIRGIGWAIIIYDLREDTTHFENVMPDGDFDWRAIIYHANQVRNELYPNQTQVKKGTS